MKKILMAIMALFVCAGMYAQKGEQAAGINLGYGSGSLHKSFKLGLEYKYNITDAIRIAPSFDYFFKDLGTSLWDINANVHYVFNIKSVDGLKVYPLAGLTLLGYSVGDGDTGSSDMDEWFEEEYGEEAASSDSGVKFGGNLGAGIQYPIMENLDLSFEIKYQFVQDFDQVVFHIGAAYKF